MNSGHKATWAAVIELFEPFVRMVQFVYLMLIWCPLRFWPLDSSWDSTWVFALNYAAANGLQNGRDVFWTTGPLGTLVFPMDVGENLERALLFQCALWAIVGLVLADSVLWPRFPLRNTAMFGVLVGLSAPLYWFNYVGLDSILLGAVLVLLAVHRWHGGWWRLLLALVLMGLTPLIKLTGGFLAAGVLLGFLVDAVIRHGTRSAGVVAACLLVPLASALAGLSILNGGALPLSGLRANFEIVRGYSQAMSVASTGMPAFSGIVTIAVVLGILWLQVKPDPSGARFRLLTIFFPLAMAVKHGFVRADEIHTSNFFAMAALLLGYSILSWSMRGYRAAAVILFTSIFGALWVKNVALERTPVDPLLMVSGLRSTGVVAIAASGMDGIRAQLRTASKETYESLRLERDLREIVGAEDVAVLSVSYQWAGLDDMRLKIYPIPQRYSAYTPILDELNADWVVRHGPRFLLFDGFALDGRNAVAETPAMFLEVLRWYNVKKKSGRNLLLERRARPRFSGLERIWERMLPLTEAVILPRGERLILMSRSCEMTVSGKLKNAILKLPAIIMTSVGEDEQFSRRVLAETMKVPAVVNFFPRELAEFALLFEGGGASSSAARIREIQFGGPGLDYFGAACRTALYRPVWSD